MGNPDSFGEGKIKGRAGGSAALWIVAVFLFLGVCSGWLVDHQRLEHRLQEAMSKDYDQTNRIMTLEHFIVTHGHDVPPPGWEPDISEALKRHRERKARRTGESELSAERIRAPERGDFDFRFRQDTFDSATPQSS